MGQPEGQQLPPPELDVAPELEPVPELDPAPELEAPELEAAPDDEDDEAPEDPAPELDTPLLEPDVPGASSPPSEPMLTPIGTALLHCARARAAPPAARNERVAKEKRFDGMASSLVCSVVFRGVSDASAFRHGFDGFDVAAHDPRTRAARGERGYTARKARAAPEASAARPRSQRAITRSPDLSSARNPLG